MDLTDLLSRTERIEALSDAELHELETDLLALFDAIRADDVEGVSPTDTEVLRSVADAVGAARTEAESRLSAAAEREAEVAEIEALIRPVAGPEEDDEESEPEGVAPVVTEDEAEAVVAEAEAILEEAPEPVAAAGAEGDALASEETEELGPKKKKAVPAMSSDAPLSALAAKQPRMKVPAQPLPAGPRVRLLSQDREVGLSELAEAMIARREGFGTFAGSGEERIPIGRLDFRSAFGAERTLSSRDSEVINTAKLEAVVADAMLPSSWTPALVASGGFCAPTPALYDLQQISGAQRPVRDSLPSFLADRGGIRYTSSPDLSDVLVDQAGGAVGEWTNTTDTTPGESIKTTQVVSCGSVQEVLTKAIYHSLQFGNFTQRAYPEWVTTWQANTLAAHARKAEQELLDSISAASTPVTTTQLLGTTRDLIPYIGQLAAAERNRQRMAPSARLRALLPAWIVTAIQMDLMRQGNVAFEVVDEATIRGWMNGLGINVTFYEDSRTGAGQIVSAQGAGNDLRNLPTTVEWYLYHEGAFQFLNGGTLDLGLVRDSTLNETNDFRLFSETWEAVAFRGIFSYRVRSAVCPSGVAAGPLLEADNTICDAS